MPLNLFQNSRMNNIFGQGMNPPSPKPFTFDFNPTTDTSDSPYGQTSGGVSPLMKRLFTGIIPKPSPDPQSIFGSNTTPDSAPASAIDPATASAARDNTDSIMNSFFTRLQDLGKDHPAETAYQNALKSPPVYNDSAPSGWRRLAAGITGGLGGLAAGPAAGVALGTSVARAPYAQALQDYDTRLKGLEGSAKIESASQADDKQNLTTAANYAVARGGQQATQDIARGELGVKQWNAKTAEAKALTDYQHELAQIDYWTGQLKNEGDKNKIEAAKAAATSRYQAALANAAGVNATSGVRNAASGEVTAAAARVRANADLIRANKPPVLKPALNPQAAYDLAMQQMHDEGTVGIDLNEGKYGKTYTINSRAPVDLTNRIKARARQLMLERGGVSEQDIANPFDFGNAIDAREIQ